MAVYLSTGIRNVAVSNPRDTGFEMQMLEVFGNRIRSCLSSAVSCIYCPFALGYDALSYSVESSDNWSGRQLLQANEENTTDVPEDGGQAYIRNCTEPGRNENCFRLLGLTVGSLASRYLWWYHLYC